MAAKNPARKTGAKRSKGKGEVDIPPMPKGGEDYGAWFDEAAAAKAEAFFPKYLRHTEGEWAGRPFELAAWQRLIVRSVFGWKRADGTRLIRRVWIEVPRKNGKTEFAAGISILCLIGDGEIGGQGYSLACDKDQAKIVFEKAGVMVSMSPALTQILEVFKTSVFCPQLKAGFKPLSNTASTKHGFSPTFAIGDEVHEWRDGEVFQVVHDGMGARAQPIEFLITTAGITDRGFANEQHDRALQILNGDLVDPTTLVVIFAADEEDDWTDEAVWAKANPNLGVSPKLDFIRQQCTEARESPRLENNFKRFHLNMWTEQVTRWLPMEKWKLCTARPDDPDYWKVLPEELKGRECWVGADLSSRSDLTALTAVFPPLEKGDRWKYLWRFFVPDERIAERSKKDRVPYDIWAKSGAITATDGNVIDYDRVRQALMDWADRFVVREIAFDRWNAQQLATQLVDEGAQVVGFGQGFGSMSDPAKDFEAQILQGVIEHGNHPVARWCAANVAIKEDPAGNIKPDKEKATEKIDGIVSAVMGLGRANVNGGEKPKTIEYRPGQMFGHAAK